MSPDLRLITQVPPSQDITAAFTAHLSGSLEHALPSYSGGTVQDLHLSSILAFVKYTSLPSIEVRYSYGITKEHKHICNYHI